MNEAERLKEALSKIAELASEASNGSYSESARTGETGRVEPIVCTPKSLPKRLLVAAAKTAVEINPVNAPALHMMAAAAADVMDPMRIAVMTQKYWGPAPRTLTVSFMESTPPDLRRKILSHMNAWSKTAGIQFAETGGTGQIRISRTAGGYWSYIGTDVLHIPQNRQTMNLEGFSMSTDESEYRRVIRHETGHTLGFPHEHMRRELVARIDPPKAYDYFLRTFGWPKEMVDQQVLTALDQNTIMGTPADQTSIMCYQLPGSITRDGKPILGGTDINSTDFDFAGRIYPKPHHQPGFETEDDFEEEYATA